MLAGVTLVTNDNEGSHENETSGRSLEVAAKKLFVEPKNTKKHQITSSTQYFGSCIAVTHKMLK